MLAGRAEQLALLDTLVSRTRDGFGQTVLVEGGAGIGKSAIISAWAERCRDGFDVRRGNSDELGSTRPFAPLLDALGHGPEGDEVRQALRDRMVRDPNAQLVVLERDPAVQSLVIDDLVTRVEDLCVIRPVALFLDDVHWADASTLAAVASLVRRARDLPLLVVLAARPVPADHQLEAFLVRLRTQPERPSVTRVELPALEPHEVIDLATAMLAAPPGPGLRSLLGNCAGNPLQVVELLATLRDSDLLAPRNDTIETASEPGELFLPTSLTETVRRRMALLDENRQAIATIAALLGTRFTLGDLAAVTGRPATELFPHVQTLVDVRLFVDDGSALSYRHDLVREAVVSALPASMRAELHRSIAAALQTAGAPTMRVAEQLALGAQPGSTDAVAVLQAAADEISQQDPAGAESLLRRALELCSITDPQRDLVCARLVDTLAWGGRLIEAESMAAEMLSRPVPPDVEIGLRSALSRTLLLLARPHEAIPHEERLIELHREQGRSTAWPLAETAVCRVFGLDLDRAIQDAQLAIAQGERDRDEMAIILGLAVHAFARATLGDSAAAMELATRAVVLADATPDGQGHRIHPNLFRGIALQSLGLHVDARRAFERGRSLGESLGAGWALPIYHFLLALGHWDRGEWDDLLTEMDSGVTYNEERVFSIGQAWAYGMAARVHVHRGELEQAVELLDKADRMVSEYGMQYGMDWIVLARALLLDVQGFRGEGFDMLRLVWETAAGLQASAALLIVGGDLARLAVDLGEERCAAKVVHELARLVERSPDDLVVRGRERRAFGLVERDAIALRDSAAIFDKLGHRFETAVVRSELAELLAAQGQADEATSLFDDALACYDGIGASMEADRVRAKLAQLSPSTVRKSPARRPVSGWGALTPTECEIAAEVCGGRSNPQVAERLGISRRTVEAHLRSIYRKLGVSTRLALAVAEREHARS